MSNIRRHLLSFVCVALLGLIAVPATFAELPQDVRDVFERMLDDLDDDLARKFQNAIDDNTATVTFTPEQFRRFRDNPINPFEGLEDIDARDGGGNIALKFELPSIRNRLIDRFERQHEHLLSQVQPQTISVSASTVRILSKDRQVALGIVVSSDGLIVSKASEVENESALKCELPGGMKVAAKIVRVDKTNDVALLSVRADGLTPVRWSDTQPLLGSFVVTPGANKTVAAIGSYSAMPRSTAAGEQAFLGVQPQTTPQGVLVSDIRPGNASHTAGLKNGDVIFRLDDINIRDVSDLVRAIRSRRPGDRIKIEFLRDGAKDETYAELAGRNLSGERAARFKMMNRLGAIPSRRGDGFPSVFQHDTPLFPEQCGGPILDLDGNVVGMNIARNGRAASYAIPSAHLQTIIHNLKRESLAARQDATAAGELQN